MKTFLSLKHFKDYHSLRIIDNASNLINQGLVLKTPEQIFSWVLIIWTAEVLV